MTFQNQCTVVLLPLGKSFQVERGTRLQDLLFAQGVEFPCGGRGLCKGCRVKVLSGAAPVTQEDTARLGERELREGWRLSCRMIAGNDLTIELAQWEAPVLCDDSAFGFTPKPGLGIAVDLGTTTIVAQLVDLETSHVLGVRTALNAQAQHGSDIMSRIEFAMTEGGQARLQELVRGQIGGLVTALLEGSQMNGGRISRIALVGNTVMHHLFCGISVEPLSAFPFEPSTVDAVHLEAGKLGWTECGYAPVVFLPCLGGFVGSDILAGILATRMHESVAPQVLMDLGTNGEIVVGNRERMLCTSTAAGPAFEGARISMGMRAATGAISEVSIRDGGLRCSVLGRTQPRGLCGSGLVDAVAASLDLGWIKPNGRIMTGEAIVLQEPVMLSQWDVRELQLAKGAIAAGAVLLLQQWGVSKDQVARVHLAGAFGNYINQNSARRIGMLDFPPAKIQPAGNTALLGAKLALFHEEHAYADLRRVIRHVSLKEDPAFQDGYVEAMGFPPQIAQP